MVNVRAVNVHPLLAFQTAHGSMMLDLTDVEAIATGTEHALFLTVSSSLPMVGCQLLRMLISFTDRAHARHCSYWENRDTGI